MKHVTKQQAEDAALAIGAALAMNPSSDAEDIGDGETTDFYKFGPKVYDRGEFGDGRKGYYAVTWEEGPYSWPYLLDGGFDEELFSMIHPEFIPDREKAVEQATRAAVQLPEGVVAEAINHYSVALFTEEEY